MASAGITSSAPFGAAQKQCAPLNFRAVVFQRARPLARKHRNGRRLHTLATASAPAIEDLELEVDNSQPSTSGRDRSHQTDYVVIGSGIGGKLIAQMSRTWHLTSCLSIQRLATCEAVSDNRIHAGLCCAALLAKYGYRVTVCESHYHAGGAAHSFEVCMIPACNALSTCVAPAFLLKLWQECQ